MMHKYDSSEVAAIDEPPDGKTLPRVGLIGVGGYSGLELARLLSRHPHCEFKVCFSTKENFRFENFLPQVPERLKNTEIANLQELKPRLKNLDVIFLATPPEVSLELVPEILKANVHVIDLSGAFRFKGKEAAQIYKKFYQFEHSNLSLVEKAHYGLSPWNKIAPTKEATLISNPGCYPTAVLMALLPLVRKGLIENDTLVIDAKSGTTGAGRKANESLLFSEVAEDCLPYKVGKHQHLPEIKAAVEGFTSFKIDPFFTTHLLPVRRGMQASLYAKLKPAVGVGEVSSAFFDAYSHYGLVQWGTVESGAHGLSLKSVVGTNFTRITYELEGDKLYLFSLIDNLLKGAAGQAIENFNQLYQLPINAGLTQWGGNL